MQKNMETAILEGCGAWGITLNPKPHEASGCQKGAESLPPPVPLLFLDPIVPLE